MYNNLYNNYKLNRVLTTSKNIYYMYKLNQVLSTYKKLYAKSSWRKLLTFLSKKLQNFGSPPGCHEQ